MSTIEQCKRQRTNIKRNITRIKTLVTTSAGEDTGLSSAELRCRLGILESYFTQAMAVQSEIETLDPSDSGRGELEDSYVETKVAIKDQLGEELNSTRPPHSPFSLAQSSSIALSSSKLPRLTLPTFDGKFAEYKNFINSFTQIIAREATMSNLEKFNHLLHSLKGPALDAIKAFPITDENYPKALQRLNERFDNSTLIFLETIDALFKLQPVEKSNAIQLQGLVDKASAMYGALESLGTGSNIAQAMLIYIVIDKCDQHTRNKWNESLDFKNLPNWKQCSKLLERHCQYLQSSNPTSQGPVHPSKSSRNMSGHRIAQCSSRSRCRSCNQAHHTMLHHDKDIPAIEARPDSRANYSVQPSDPITFSHLHTRPGQVILATAVVLVKDASGTYRPGRALLDACSQVNLINEEFAQKLRLRHEKFNMGIRSVGDSLTHIKHLATTTIQSRITDCHFSLEFCVISHISYQPDSEIDISSWKLPTNTPLADDRFHESRRIDLLLGAEVFFHSLAVGQIKLAPHLPILQKTLFGWVIAGRCQQQQKQVSDCFMSSTVSIENHLQKLWELESVAASPESLHPHHQICEALYTSTTVQDSHGRIVVNLPFKDDPSRLGNSAEVARRRFYAMERRMLKFPELRSQYVSFMQEYQALGHMSLVTSPALHESHYYIPHHCVLKPSSTSTKLRVVFDASCTTTSQLSLNDLLFVGPTVQTDLYLQLLKFRLFQYALTADVTKMYRQVLVDQSFRKYQYIFWRDSPDAQLQTFQLNTVTYGTGAAPYLAVRSLHYLADKYKEEFPTGASVIKSSLYVDDLLCEADDIDTLRLIKQEVIEVLQRGNFPLTKWHSNHPEFTDYQPTKRLHICEDNVTSALGVIWNQLDDAFLFTFASKQPTLPATKRSILSIASSLFDPLGLLSPIIIVAKMILQELLDAQS
nr:uncharacterized protein LOC123003146 [Drosophila takahashii]